MKCTICHSDVSMGEFAAHVEFCKQSIWDQNSQPFKCWTCESEHPTMDDVRTCGITWGGRTKRVVLRERLATVDHFTMGDKSLPIIEKTSTGLILDLDGQKISLLYKDIDL